MAGTTGYTPIDNDDEFGFDQINALAQHFDESVPQSVATASALPASGNWVGRILSVADSGLLYICTALPSTWRRINETHLDAHYAFNQGITATGNFAVLTATLGAVPTYIGTVVSTTRFVPAIPGRWRASATMEAALALTQGFSDIAPYKNGSYIQGARGQTLNGNGAGTAIGRPAVSCEFFVNVNGSTDYLEIKLAQSHSNPDPQQFSGFAHFEYRGPARS